MRGNAVEKFIQVKGLEETDVNMICRKTLEGVRIGRHHDDRHVDEAISTQTLDQRDTISTGHVEIAQHKIGSYGACER